MNLVHDGWWSFDPEDGFQTHPSEEEAKKRAEDAFEASREDGVWAENVEEICYGKVTAIVTEISHKGETYDFGFRDPHQQREQVRS